MSAVIRDWALSISNTRVRAIRRTKKGKVITVWKNTRVEVTMACYAVIDQTDSDARARRDVPRIGRANPYIGLTGVQV